ncbi:hypothetical protein HQ35_01470 [Porphyromonas cangingivalis]|uniref:Uncharacterized protein n=2 Tax=Porphyromonas cangingivalis TaxID=36874 RepID=A0A0A2F389_PORCN|nr:hypothetical protein HQ35_01470 [Porphyromonas cangingivalis]
MKKIHYLFLSLCLLLLFNIHSDASTQNGIDLPGPQTHQVDMERYELYPTQNMWIFLKLDTATGRIWMVQYSLEGNRKEVFLNPTQLAHIEVDSGNKRFKLHPTQNMYNFLLLDQRDGRVWQVQWSFNEDARMILPIY